MESCDEEESHCYYHQALRLETPSLNVPELHRINAYVYSLFNTDIHLIRLFLAFDYKTHLLYKSRWTSCYYGNNNVRISALI